MYSVVHVYVVCKVIGLPYFIKILQDHSFCLQRHERVRLPTYFTLLSLRSLFRSSVKNTTLGYGQRITTSRKILKDVIDN
jgi:hypothetical protein